MARKSMGGGGVDTFDQCLMGETRVLCPSVRRRRPRFLHNFHNFRGLVESRFGPTGNNFGLRTRTISEWRMVRVGLWCDLQP